MTSKDIRLQFPALTQKVRGTNLTYLDSAATSLKPVTVIERMQEFYSYEASNIHRGAHYLADAATEKYEKVREGVRSLINASSTDEIIFTSGTTDGVNLLAHGLVTCGLSEGDEILLTQMEHHSNIVPWQVAAERIGAKVKFANITNDGRIDLESFKSSLTEKTKVVSFTHISNALGTLNPVEEMTKLSQQFGAKVIIDAAQSIANVPIDVRKIGCDFLVFSAHKMFGPFGVGVLYGKKNLLDGFPPYRSGGSMISDVDVKGTTFLNSPYRFEAGTPNIGGIIGFGAAIEILKNIGYEQIQKTEKALVAQLLSALQEIPGVEVYGPMGEQKNLVSFNLQGVHPSDVGQILDQMGVAVRAGHHCALPLMKYLKISGTVRASFSVYNNSEDIDQLVKSIFKAKELLQ